MDYYNYTDEFRELIINTETIITNQENIESQNREILETTSILAFALILYIIITFVRRIFNRR